MLNKTTKRKRKTMNEENNKTKSKRYRRGCVADEVPSKIILDDDEEEEEEEPGEIIEDIDERQQTSFKPFNYATINEDDILSKSKSRFFFRKKKENLFIF
jgi:hypothetical protein